MARKHDPVTLTKPVQASVEAHLKARGLTDKWLIEKMGIPKGSYYDMWRRGSMRIDLLQIIASAFPMTLAQLVAGPAAESPTATAEPAGTYLATPSKRAPYIEERIDDLEQRLRALEQRKPVPR